MSIIEKIWDKDIIVEDTHVIQDLIHDSISSDLALETNLEDLDYTQFSGVGPSTEVNFIPTTLIDDDNFIDDDDEYNVAHVLRSDPDREDDD